MQTAPLFTPAPTPHRTHPPQTNNDLEQNIGEEHISPSPANEKTIGVFQKVEGQKTLSLPHKTDVAQFQTQEQKIKVTLSKR
jgi:hypothetical protein